MNMKTSKKMRGFMCQSTSAAAVCNVSDPRSVIVPRRLQLLDLHNSSNNPLINHSASYSKLVRSHSFSSSNNRPVFVSSIKNRQDSSTRSFRDHPKPKPILQPPPSLPSSDQIFQVVVMRVSLHCQGCAGKVKKHLTKMQGVTSFSIDLENKMVTVMGHVSPVGVLESISKVKRAEFWPCSSSTTASSTVESNSAHQLLIK